MHTCIHTRIHTNIYTSIHTYMDHLLYDCEILGKEREKLIAYTSKEEDWPVRKRELVNKYLKQLKNFANSIDFEKLQ